MGYSSPFVYNLYWEIVADKKVWWIKWSHLYEYVPTIVPWSPCISITNCGGLTSIHCMCMYVCITGTCVFSFMYISYSCLLYVGMYMWSYYALVCVYIASMHFPNISSVHLFIPVSAALHKNYCSWR